MKGALLPQPAAPGSLVDGVVMRGFELSLTHSSNYIRMGPMW
jgi:hypothetical protein